MNKLVIYAGRFQPFHKGHFATYQYLTKKYGADSVYIATSGKQAPVTSPFTFDEKKYMMQITGVPVDKIYQTRIPYQPTEITDQFNKDKTSIIFALSEKDTRRFTFKPKKDGSPSYMQPLPEKDNLGPMSSVGYVEVAPVFVFKVMGKEVQSASEIRKMFTQVNEAKQKQIISELYGSFDPKIYEMFAKELTIAENTLNIIRNMKANLTESNKAQYTKFVETVTLLERNANKLDEAPIELDRENPNDPMIYGNNINPGKLSYRKQRAMMQLQDLVELASNDQWTQIVSLFPELQMNISAIRHGIEELEKVRKKGGINSRGINPI